MKLKQKTEENKTIESVMKKHDGCFCLSIHEGYANITIMEGKFEVNFVTDEGGTLLSDYGDTVSFESIKKVTSFVDDLKSIKKSDSEV